MKISWWQWLPFWRWRLLGFVPYADEIPVRLPRNGAVAVGDDPGQPKWLAFDCPCRSGHRVMLNTDPRRSPWWQFDLRKPHSLSIVPSVDYLAPPKRCHYFVRDGRIQWSRDSVR